MFEPLRVESSHLLHTVCCPWWKPGAAEGPAWPAATMTSEAESQTCTWSSFRWLFWTVCHWPPHLSKSCLDEITKQLHSSDGEKHKHQSSTNCEPWLFLLGHWLHTGMGDKSAVSLVTKKTSFSWRKKKVQSWTQQTVHRVRVLIKGERLLLLWRLILQMFKWWMAVF